MEDDGDIMHLSMSDDAEEATDLASGMSALKLKGNALPPLHAAAGFGDIATVRVLLNMKVDINAASVSTLIYFNQLLHNHAGADA